MDVDNGWWWVAADVGWMASEVEGVHSIFIRMGEEQKHRQPAHEYSMEVGLLWRGVGNEL